MLAKSHAVVFDDPLLAFLLRFILDNGLGNLDDLFVKNGVAVLLGEVLVQVVLVHERAVPMLLATMHQKVEVLFICLFATGMVA